MDIKVQHSTMLKYIILLYIKKYHMTFVTFCTYIVYIICTTLNYTNYYLTKHKKMTFVICKDNATVMSLLF